MDSLTCSLSRDAAVRGLTGGHICALADPRQGNQAFGGVSARASVPPPRTQHVGASRRLRQGATAKEKWLADLLSNGLHPRVIVLERDIQPSVLGVRERAWIARSSRGGTLLQTLCCIARTRRPLICGSVVSCRRRSESEPLISSIALCERQQM